MCSAGPITPTETLEDLEVTSWSFVVITSSLIFWWRLVCLRSQLPTSLTKLPSVAAATTGTCTVFLGTHSDSFYSWHFRRFCRSYLTRSRVQFLMSRWSLPLRRGVSATAASGFASTVRCVTERRWCWHVSQVSSKCGESFAENVGAFYVAVQKVAMNSIKQKLRVGFLVVCYHPHTCLWGFWLLLQSLLIGYLRVHTSGSVRSSRDGVSQQELGATVEYTASRVAELHVHWHKKRYAKMKATQKQSRRNQKGAVM